MNTAFEIWLELPPLGKSMVVAFFCCIFAYAALLVFKLADWIFGMRWPEDEPEPAERRATDSRKAS